MSRSFLFLAILAILNNVYYSQEILPPQPPNQPVCNSVLCNKNTNVELDVVIQKAAQACSRAPCGQKIPFYLDLYSLCQGYTNYDPKTNSIIQCVINKLSNPCYEEYYGLFIKTLNKGCSNVCQRPNFNIYTFLSDVCYSCNGFLDGCYIQSGQQIYYATPLAASNQRQVSTA